jgi:ethanolamine utilization protein EutN
MLIAKVVGNVWSTKKNEGIHALRLLIVEPIGKDGKPSGPTLVAADDCGAGKGELVLITQGSPATMVFKDQKGQVPVDAAVIGIVDSFELSEK